MANRWGNSGNSDRLLLGCSKITIGGDWSHEIKMLAPWKKSYDQPRQHIKKQRHYFTDKGPANQSYGFPSSHVWMWELDHKESWTLKNLMFLNSGVVEDSWESLGQQGDQTSQCYQRSTLNIHWKDWCWSWNSSILVVWCEQLTY